LNCFAYIVTNSVCNLKLGEIETFLGVFDFREPPSFDFSRTSEGKPIWAVAVHHIAWAIQPAIEIITGSQK
jgi:hypothetical protein